MKANLIARILLGASLAMCALPAVAMPALAECTGQPNRWPAFEEVAPTARQVVIGTVTKTNKGDEVDYSSVFTLEVEDVLRGEAPAVIEVDRLRSGLPLRGARSCIRDATLLAGPGNRLALAIDGRIRGTKGRLSTAAWIEGQPPFDTNPGVRTMELNEVRQVMGLEPLPSFRAIISGSSASIEGDTLVLEGVPAVPYVSEWPSPVMGSWDVDSFVEGWEAASGLDRPTAVLSLGTSYGGDRFAVEVTDIETVGETLQVTISATEGTAPTRFPASASLFVEIGADPRTWTATA